MEASDASVTSVISGVEYHHHTFQHALYLCALVGKLDTTKILIENGFSFEAFAEKYNDQFCFYVYGYGDGERFVRDRQKSIGKAPRGCVHCPLCVSAKLGHLEVFEYLSDMLIPELRDTIYPKLYGDLMEMLIVCAIFQKRKSIYKYICTSKHFSNCIAMICRGNHILKDIAEENGKSWVKLTQKAIE